MAALGRLGYEGAAASCCYDVVPILTQHPCWAVILDLSLPDLDGRECLALLRDTASDIKIVVSSGREEGDSRKFMTGLQVDAFLPKPYDLAGLRDMLVTLEC